jgi:hypothetical protein
MEQEHSTGICKKSLDKGMGNKLCHKKITINLPQNNDIIIHEIFDLSGDQNVHLPISCKLHEVVSTESLGNTQYSLNSLCDIRLCVETMLGRAMF